MPKVTVSPISNISVRVGPPKPGIVQSTSTFIGATDVQTEIQVVRDEANLAVQQANTAVALGTTGYDFVTYGGNIGGDVTINHDLTVAGNNAYIAGNVIITGDFIGTVDGGTY